MKRDKRQTCNVIPLTIGVLLVVMLLHGLAAGKITVKAGKNQDKIVVNARSSGWSTTGSNGSLQRLLSLSAICGTSTGAKERPAALRSWHHA
jgi:hypothetical protein